MTSSGKEDKSCHLVHSDDNLNAIDAYTCSGDNIVTFLGKHLRRKLTRADKVADQEVQPSLSWLVSQEAFNHQLRVFSDMCVATIATT